MVAQGGTLYPTSRVILPVARGDCYDEGVHVPPELVTDEAESLTTPGVL